MIMYSVQFCTVLYCTVFYCSVYFTMCCTLLYYVLCPVLFFTMYCTVLFSTVLYYNVYCTVMCQACLQAGRRGELRLLQPGGPELAGGLPGGPHTRLAEEQEPGGRHLPLPLTPHYRLGGQAGGRGLDGG